MDDKKSALFFLDLATIGKIADAAQRLGMSKSAFVTKCVEVTYAKMEQVEAAWAAPAPTTQEASDEQP